MDDREYHHSEKVPSAVTCMMCVCYYGNVVCHDVQCPIPKPGCKKIEKTTKDVSQCCPELICDEEAPTVVLDRSDETNPDDELIIAERVVTPDPFKDVIKTEPAPNLQSLIGDMIPHIITTSKLVTTTMPSIDTTTITSVKNTTKLYDTLDQMLQYLLGEVSNSDNKISTTVDQTTTTVVPIRDNLNINNLDNNIGGGLLKLAGCNIYGRMYRVGRIIFELSGPCLECKCTETGVQCNSLKC